MHESLDRRPHGRPPRALVVRDLGPEESAAPVDWSAWYLTDEEDMGESVEHWCILSQLLSALGRLAVERGWKDVLLASDTFFAWVKEEPLVRVSPDAYLLDDPPPPPRPKSWQTWLPGHKAPRWALEVVSEDWKKDYEDNPPKYAQLGARELVLFDAEAESGERVPFQVFRRAPDGAFVQVYRGDGPAHSEELDAWLIAVKDGAAVRLRIARDAAGTDLVPTAEEQVVATERRIRELEAELARQRAR